MALHPEVDRETPAREDVIVVLASMIVFAATQALPSDPAKAILGKQATPERLEALRVQLNLDRPLVEQYGSWMQGVVSGDLGDSLATRGPVSDLLGPRFKNSLTLMALVALISLPLSFLFGVLTGRAAGTASSTARSSAFRSC